MRTKKAIFFLLVFLSYIPVLAQVDTAWVRRYHGSGNGYDNPRALAVDANGNMYVTGYSYGGDLNYDYATIKYSAVGDTLWVRRYNGPGKGHDNANALAVDGNGNVYVTGESFGGPTFNDYATIKYSSAGDTMWTRRYNGPGETTDVATALALDAGGNVYVTGYSYSGSLNYDYATIKYSSAGNALWVRRYNGPGNYDDFATALAVDDSGNVYVTGRSWGSGTIFDYATIKYSSAGGTMWTRRYNGPENGDEYAYALAVDESGNVYVSGYSDGTGTSDDYATIKYSPLGDTLWVRRYNGTGNSFDVAHALAVDDSGNVYVTGESVGGSTSNDYATIKYSSAGDTLWVRRYNGSENGYDFATALALDGSANVYVTGQSSGSGPYDDYTTIKYSQFQCLAKPGDANNDNDILLSDIISIINFLFKSQPAPTPSCRADANADGNVLLSDIVYLINFIFKSGPGPQKSRECCL